jgi:hypothetical protein
MTGDGEYDGARIDPAALSLAAAKATLEEV